MAPERGSSRLTARALADAPVALEDVERLAQLDAVRAALRLVATVGSSGLPAAHAGVHAGPVIMRDGDHFGRTVNVAARISSLAAPGEVWTSADIARREARDLDFRPVGSQELKSVGRVQLFAAHRRAGSGRDLPMAAR